MLSDSELAPCRSYSRLTASQPVLALISALITGKLWNSKLWTTSARNSAHRIAFSSG